MAYALEKVVLLATGIVTLLLFFTLRARKRSSPPGPPGWPVIGNLLDLPKKESWKVYLDWGRQYNSDVLSLRLPGGIQFFILNSAEAIQDLLARRSLIYSDRPRSTMLGDLMGTDWLIPFMNYTDKWKEHRRLFRREFDTANASQANRNHEVQAARRLLVRLLTTNDHRSDLRLAAVDAILSITYGIIPTGFEHPFIKTPEQVNEIFADVARGGYLVDVFPFLKFLPKWLPGATFHSVADKGRKLTLDLLMGPYKEIETQVANGTAMPSVASRFLYSIYETQNGDARVPDNEIEMMRSVLGNAYLGGADTSVCALQNFALAMALHPQVQRKAQIALDEVTGNGRILPNFSDFQRLPYISAIVNEVLRWHPVTPFAIYHLATKDDEYRGYTIPKGSVMVPNAWAVLHDENIFGSNPNKFIPERFMRPDGTIKPELSDMDSAFGFGRRSCPGRLMARDTIWIMAAHILTAYDIVDARDERGDSVTADSDLEFTNAMVSFAPNIGVTFKRRIPESVLYDSLDHA